MDTQWDPIELGLNSEIVTSTIKRQIRNILKSYTGWFDPLGELIQNAIDAVESHKRRNGDHSPHIWIEINLQQNRISITDNGLGFKEDEFKTFLAPNVSYKTHTNRGNKGVGATYLAYGFNFLQLGTKTPDYTFVGVLKDGREWVEDEKNIKTRPKIQQAEPVHSIFSDIEMGSTFTLQFSGDFIRPRDLKWVGANNAQQWEKVLKIKTALGGIYIGREMFPLICTINVIDEEGITTTSECNECQYLFPNKIFPYCKQLDEITSTQTKLLSQGKDGSKLPQSFYKLNGIYESWNTPLDNLPGDWTPEEKALAAEYKIGVYGFFGYSAKLWDKYNDETLHIRKGAKVLRGGIQLATNCMPQGEILPIPLLRNIGYQNQTHVVIHFDEADPDLGRKGFQPELEDLAKHIGVSVVTKLSAWRHLLQKDTGAPPDIVELGSIHDWISQQEAHEKDYPLIIKRTDLFLPTRQPSITSLPTSEQDVIALFNQLLAGGVIRGVKILATNQHQQYDGIFRLSLMQPFENHIYDKEKNPLGIDNTQVTSEFLGPPNILEYKYSVDGLIDEIENEIKNERHINLVIAWEMGESWKTRYDITPLLHFDNIQHRYFHGGTHLLSNSSTGDSVFPAIILSELIDYINDPEAVQEYQKSTYMEL